MRALAWLWFRRLAQRGKDAGDYLSTFNDFLVRSVSSGRRVTGYEKAKDALCVRTQKRRGFKVERLPKEFRASHESLYSTVHGQHEHDAFEERLSDNSITPIPDQAAFRIDWPAWMQTQTERDRRIIDDSMAGERTFEVSKNSAYPQDASRNCAGDCTRIGRSSVRCRTAGKKSRYEYWTDMESRLACPLRRPPGGAAERIFLLVVAELGKQTGLFKQTALT
jgi:hypothetical protein